MCAASALEIAKPSRCRALRDGCQFLRLERAEKNFYAARAQSRREFRWRARRGAHQAKVRRHAVVKHVVNPTWRSGIVGIVISAFKAHHAVFQHLEQFVHLHGMQLPDFIQKKHPAMRPRDRALFGLGHAAGPQLTRPLINGIVHAADQGIGNGALVEAHTGGVHFDKRRVRQKWRSFRALCRLQGQPGRTGFAHARRAVNQHMLRMRAGEHGHQRFHGVALPNDVLQPRWPGLFAQRLAQMNPPQGVEPLPFRLRLAARVRRALRRALRAHLPEKVHAHHKGRRQLRQHNDVHQHTKHTSRAFPGFF